LALVLSLGGVSGGDVVEVTVGAVVARRTGGIDKIVGSEGSGRIDEGRVSTRSDSEGKPHGFSSYTEKAFGAAADEEELAHGLPMYIGATREAGGDDQLVNESLPFSSFSAPSPSFGPGYEKSFETPAYAS
jgi:hypothetical protein